MAAQRRVYMRPPHLTALMRLTMSCSLGSFRNLSYTGFIATWKLALSTSTSWRGGRGRWPHPPPTPVHAGLAEIVQFLWVVSADFKPSKEARDEFFKRIVAILDIEKARADISEYLDRAYLDSSHRSAQSAPMVSSAAYYAHNMAGEPYRMAWRDVLDAPLAVLHQLIKARTESAGEIVVNKRSDKVTGDWLKLRNEQTERRMKRNRRKEHGR